MVDFKPKDAPPRLALRRPEAAKALGISERTLWAMTQTGDVPHVRLGGCVLYPMDGLREWLARQTKAAGLASTGGNVHGMAPSYSATGAKAMRNGGGR